MIIDVSAMLYNWDTYAIVGGEVALVIQKIYLSQSHRGFSHKLIFAFYGGKTVQNCLVFIGLSLNFILEMSAQFAG